MREVGDGPEARWGKQLGQSPEGLEWQNAGPDNLVNQAAPVCRLILWFTERFKRDFGDDGSC